MRLLLATLTALAVSSPALALTAKATNAIKTVIRGHDYACPNVDKVIGPIATERGKEFSVHCGHFRYIMTISPSGRFYVRVR